MSRSHNNGHRSVGRGSFRVGSPSAVQGGRPGPSAAVTPSARACVCTRVVITVLGALVSTNVGQRDSSPLPDYTTTAVALFFPSAPPPRSWRLPPTSSSVLFLLHLTLLLAFSIILLYSLFTHARTHAHAPFYATTITPLQVHAHQSAAEARV